MLRRYPSLELLVLFAACLPPLAAQAFVPAIKPASKEGQEALAKFKSPAP